MKKLLISITIIISCLNVFGQKLGLNGNLNLTSLDTFKTGYGLGAYAEIALSKRISIVPNISYTNFGYKKRETISGGDLSITTNEKTSIGCYGIGISGLYKFLEIGNFNSKLGPKCDLLCFPELKGILTDNTRVEPVYRLLLGMSFNAQVNNIFNSRFGLDFNANIGYLNKSDKLKQHVYRDFWKDFVNYQFQVGVFYELP